MTQLEALKVAYEELSSMMPDGENDEIFEAAEVIEKMIYTKERQAQRQAQKSQLKHAPMSRVDREYKREINSMFNDLFDSM